MFTEDLGRGKQVKTRRAECNALVKIEEYGTLKKGDGLKYKEDKGMNEETKEIYNLFKQKARETIKYHPDFEFEEILFHCVNEISQDNKLKPKLDIIFAASLPILESLVESHLEKLPISKVYGHA